jgi:two-component system cell cycle sensor histidine kinase/response regulator CckA
MASAANPNGRLVLVVDDEPVIVRAITWALARAGFRATVAENGEAGLQTFLADPNAIDLVLADAIMPMMHGITMVRQIRQVRPDIPVLFMSAYPEKFVNTTYRAKFPMIQKPFLMEDLIRAVTEVLGRRARESSAQ